jgi:alcohol dehydrogenase (NADP+)
MTLGYAAYDAKSPLREFSFERRNLRPRDVAIDILFCGVCHSDIHSARSEWSATTYPLVPGHEIVGRVTAVGAEVTRFEKGALAAVGCMVDSDRTCAACKDGLEQYCESGLVGTYGGVDRVTGEPTRGGYSQNIVVDEHFVLRVPKNLPLAGAAPLLCAGITTWSPLRHWKVGKGQRVGVVGLGGLGHMGVKLAHALGAEVTLFTTSPGKAEDARRLGAADVVISKDAAAMAKQKRRFDFILDTVSAVHDIGALLEALKLDGTLCLVGAPEKPLALNSFNVILKRRQVAGSLIGGIPETQELLDFCGEHGISADVEVIPMQKINEAYERMIKSDVKYRFSIDMASLK